MSALDIETYIAAKASLNVTRPWTLFEVICDGQLGQYESPRYMSC